MTTPLLRRAGPGDAGRLCEFGARTFVETFLEGFAIPYPADDLKAYMTRAYSADAFAAKLAHDRHACWLAERDGELLGYASAGPCVLPHPDVAPDDAELHRLYVARSAQGLGLGRTLLETALRWMEAQGPGPLWLGVWSGNLRAQKLYTAYGFEKVGEYAFPVGSWRDEEFIFRKARTSG